MAANTTRSSRGSPNSFRSIRHTESGREAAEPGPSSTAPSAPTTYNVRDYQNPDAGAADLPLTKTSKGKTDSKGKKGGTTTVVCFNCGRAAPKLLRCGQCHHAHYCGPKVSPMRGKG